MAVTKGSKTTSSTGAAPQAQSYSETRYFQGVGGEVKDSTGKYTLVTDDEPQYAGMTAESLTYLNSDKGTPRKRTLNYPWSKQTASRFREAEDGADMDPLLAHRSGVKRTDEIQKVDDSWQAVRTLTTVDDTYGIPIQVETAVVKPDGSGETLSDQICTTRFIRQDADDRNLFYTPPTEDHIGNPAYSKALTGLHLRACLETGICPDGREMAIARDAAATVAFGVTGGVGGARGLKKTSGGCTKCFLAGTDVLMADGTTKDIEDVELGEEVEATNPVTGESGPRKVASRS